MKENSGVKIQNSGSKTAAFLWDESFLWGVMAYKALSSAGLSFKLIRAEDIRRGALAEYGVLFVPGGWASNKAKALGDRGIQEIRDFVAKGGSYLGFCGGAGLATEDGIGLLPIKRRPTAERVPSFSGRILLEPNDHPVWHGITAPVFHVWWPSQFVISGQADVLASYKEAMPDSFSSDINVGDAESAGSWPELEQRYGINLDPGRLSGEPAVIEGRFGEGRALLSLVHFDTIGDEAGACVLKNIWRHLGCPIQTSEPSHVQMAAQGSRNTVHSSVVAELAASTEELISIGLRNFLWFWRSPMLLQWRRGVRGLEYCTLAVMMRELNDLMHRTENGDFAADAEDRLMRIKKMLLPFVEKSKQLLIRERFALQQKQITYERCDDPEIQTLRDELFSRSKSHGGFFKDLIDEIDGLIYDALICNRMNRP